MTLRSLGITVSRNMPMPIDPQRSAAELDVEAKVSPPTRICSSSAGLNVHLLRLLFLPDRHF